MSGFIHDKTARLTATSKDAVVSGAYIYPLHGITYLLSHSALRKPLYDVALPATLLSVGVFAAVFGLLYIPQVAVLAVVNGPVAFVNAALLCLNESAFLINTLARAFLLEDALLAVFDATLIEKGQTALVERGREVKRGGGKSSIAKLGKLVTKPLGRFSPAAFIEYLCFLPLNAIPVVGTAAFILVQGYRAGPRLHARYFDLKKFTPEEKSAFITKSRGAYTSFGTAAALLAMIPFASIPIQFTNMVGGALWAAALETETTGGGAAVSTVDEDRPMASGEL
ncbi:hypothetical protein DL93DRAFT_2152643 [Clavulina sp. PMI_390]|nr:hypothetical protein DL93DRAFT_2152643 [Clavulina sp. PMI_390]